MIESVQFKQPDIKSKMIIGNLTIMNTKHFNLLNKIMFKIFFGIKIEDVKQEEEDV